MKPRLSASRTHRKITVTGHEWSNPIPDPRDKRTFFDFILRRLLEQNEGSNRRELSIAEASMKKRIIFDSEIAGFAAMGTSQVTNHFSLVSVLQSTRRQIRRKEEIYMQWTPGHSNYLGN